jgi:hypothetical protein
MKSILCFSRSYLANLFSELGKMDSDHEYLHIVQSREELRLIEGKGGKVILCLEYAVKNGMKVVDKETKFCEPEDFREVTNFFWSPIMSDRYLSYYKKEKREQIAFILFNALEKAFKEYKFDYFMSEPVALFSAQIMLYFSKKNGINVRLWSPCYFPGYFYFSSNLTNSLATCSRKENIKANDCSEFIRTFSSNVTLDKSGPKYHHSFADKEKSFFAYFKQRRGTAPTVIDPDFKTKVIQIMRLSFALFIKFTYPYLGDFQLATSWREHWFYLKCLFFSRFFYNKIPEAFSENNIFFPLHFEPESSLSYMAPANSIQIELIEYILKSLPKDKVLWVKEHPNQFGALNMKKWKDLRKKYSNLKYIFGRESGRVLMKRSALVISISSSAGMDALLLGKNVIVLGDVFYKNFSGSLFCDNIPKISILLNKKDIYVLNNGKGQEAIEDLCQLGLLSYEGDPQPSKTLFSESNLNNLLTAIKTEFI